MYPYCMQQSTHVEKVYSTSLSSVHASVPPTGYRTLSCAAQTAQVVGIPTPAENHT